MKYWLGVTDSKWYSYLSARNIDEVNFWQPSATPPFKQASVGMPFVFKLRHPYNHVAGGGFLVTYSRLPLSMAWEVFGEKNGCASLPEFLELVTPLMGKRSLQAEIGCTVLTNCFYFHESQWIANPTGWAPNTVRGKFYDSSESDGEFLWAQIGSRIRNFSRGQRAEIAMEDSPRYGNPQLVKPRIGQAAFRVLVTDAYQRKCAITGENTLVTLEAAHIVPYSEEGDHEVKNGILLRADFQRLYDVGLVGITPELHIRVSPKIREAWFNGRNYYRLDNEPLHNIPSNASAKPDPDRLDWHMKNRFQS